MDSRERVPKSESAMLDDGQRFLGRSVHDQLVHHVPRVGRVGDDGVGAAVVVGRQGVLPGHRHRRSAGRRIPDGARGRRHHSTVRQRSGRRASAESTAVPRAWASGRSRRRSKSERLPMTPRTYRLHQRTQAVRSGTVQGRATLCAKGKRACPLRRRGSGPPGRVEELDLRRDE